MTRPTAQINAPSNPDNGNGHLAARLLRATRAADMQGLSLRRATIRCGNEHDRRYDLIYQRYNQPVALNLKLTAVEAWLGLRQTRR